MAGGSSQWARMKATTFWHIDAWSGGRSPHQVNSHIQAEAHSVDAVMEDYMEESVLVTPDRTYRAIS